MLRVVPRLGMDYYLWSHPLEAGCDTTATVKVYIDSNALAGYRHGDCCEAVFGLVTNLDMKRISDNDRAVWYHDSGTIDIQCCFGTKVEWSNEKAVPLGKETIISLNARFPNGNNTAWDAVFTVNGVCAYTVPIRSKETYHVCFGACQCGLFPKVEII